MRSNLFGFGALGFALSIAIAVTGGYIFEPKRNVVYGPFTLASMRTADGLMGSFILGSGSIESTSTYHFMMQNDDGSLIPKQVAVDGLVHIKEDPALKNVGYWSQTRKEVDRTARVCRWVICESDKWDIVLSNDFRVPVGTVVHNFAAQ
jgi:hypothetical protein